MAQQIIIEPSRLWDYYRENEKKLLSTMLEIASNPEYGIEIYITRGDGFGRIVVYADDDMVYSESLIGSADYEPTASKIYNKYLTSSVVDILSGLNKDEDGYNYDSEGLDLYDMLDEDDSSFYEMEDAIYERENELDVALDDFLSVVDVKYDDAMFEDVKEHILEYLYRKFGVRIYRPMYLEDENGEEFFEEYPYESMVFDDVDNPLYK